MRSKEFHNSKNLTYVQQYPKRSMQKECMFNTKVFERYGNNININVFENLSILVFIGEWIFSIDRK